MRDETREITESVCALGMALAGCALYAATAAPSVATIFDDSLEFQVVLPTLGIAHPSGYPLYTLLGWLVTHLLPVRDPAGRANLFSALAAGAAVGVFFLLATHVARHRTSAAVVTAAFAISPVWWSQATLAEVYALHGLFIVVFLYLLLRWEEATLTRRIGNDRWLAAAALTAGLGMAHHRMIALLLPAALVLILWTDPQIVRRPRRWLFPLALGLAPLLLYLYLPLRGQAVSSLDGTYAPTPAGTLDWILARGYNVFLTGNPFNVHRTAGFYLAMITEQAGPLLLLAACGGLLVAWRFNTRRYVFLLLTTIVQVAFGLAYKVQDVEVFFIPAFILLFLWAALGLVPILDGLHIWLAAQGWRWPVPSRARRWLATGATLLLAALLLFEPARQALRGLPETNRSRDWQVYDLGQDALSAPATDGEVIGLQGEVTLLRYFRDVLGERKDLATVAADKETARYAAIDDALARGRRVYLTRDLPGVAARYSLDAAGPLIEVSARAAPAPVPAGRDMGDGVVLVDAHAALRQTHAGPVVRVNLVWAAEGPTGEALKVSARLMSGDQVLAANDQVPVHFAYPTTAWVPGETVTDVYDLEPPRQVPGGEYGVLVILYREADGQEVGRAELPPLTVGREAN